MNQVFKNGRLPFFWSLIFILFLLSLLVTPLNMITINLVMVPLLFLYAKMNWKGFALTLAANLLILFLVAGQIGLVLAIVPLFFLPASIVMGRLYKLKASAQRVVVTGTLVLVAEMLIMLLSARMSGIDIIGSFKATLQDSLNMLPDSVKSYIPEDSVAITVRMIPFFIILFSVYYSFLTHGVTRWLLRKTGVSVPGLPPLVRWKIPRSLVFYYLAVIVLDLVVGTGGADSYAGMIVLNLLPLLTIAFMVQGISFLSFFISKGRGNKAVPWISGIIIAVVPWMIYLFGMLGLLDTAFPIRERFSDKS